MYPEQRQLQVEGPWGGRLARLAKAARIVWLASLAVTAGLALYPKSGMLGGEMLTVRADYWGHTLVWIWLAALPFCFERRAPRAARLALLTLPYGLVLETLQIFVPGRSFELADLASDALGVALGMALGLVLSRLSRV